jgi:hypothetical protein
MTKIVAMLLLVGCSVGTDDDACDLRVLATGCESGVATATVVNAGRLDCGSTVQIEATIDGYVTAGVKWHFDAEPGRERVFRQDFEAPDAECFVSDVVIAE